MEPSACIGVSLKQAHANPRSARQRIASRKKTTSGIRPLNAGRLIVPQDSLLSSVRSRFEPGRRAVLGVVERRLATKFGSVVTRGEGYGAAC